NFMHQKLHVTDGRFVLRHGNILTKSVDGIAWAAGAGLLPLRLCESMDQKHDFAVSPISLSNCPFDSKQKAGKPLAAGDSTAAKRIRTRSSHPAGFCGRS